MRALSLSLIVVVSAACPATPPVEGEGEGDVGEGEGEEGEGEGDVGEGEGEGEVGEGEGEGEGEGDGPADGFGAISGDCGVLDVELDGADPAFFVSHFDFGADPFDKPDDVPLLTEGGQEILADGNAGGSSIDSEIFAFEFLARCEGAVLIKTENEIEYTVADSAIADFSMNIGGVVLAANPVRTFVFPPGTPLSTEEADRRLRGKLEDAAESTANAVAGDAWVKEIILVWAPEEAHVAVVRDVWDSLPSETRGNHIVWVVVSDGADDFIY